MTVKEVITKLLDYNMDAKVTVIAHCKDEDFSFTYGDREGVEKHNCESVGFYVDRLCGREQMNNES